MLESNQALVETSRKFNLFSRNDPIQAFFGVKPLDSLESEVIEKLLENNFSNQIDNQNQIIFDIDQIKTLTSEIKSINNQGALLIGERIYKARDILKSYVNGTFVKWIDATFDSRKTGYNMLAYYELYLSLPVKYQEDFKKMPQKAAYILASRTNNIDQKTKFISDYHHLKNKELLLSINEQLPLPRKTHFKKPIFNFKEIFKSLQEIKVNKHLLREEHKNTLKSISKLIEDLIV